MKRRGHANSAAADLPSQSPRGGRGVGGSIIGCGGDGILNDGRIERSEFVGVRLESQQPDWNRILELEH